MKRENTNQDSLLNKIGYKEKITSPIIGRIADSKQSGEVMVVFNGNRPAPARLLSGVNRNELVRGENIGREVLLMFEEGDPDRPIVIGQMESLLDDLVSMEIDQTQEGDSKPKDAFVDGERVVFEAKKEIMLKCGKGSILLRNDGKIVIKGTNLLSRSSGPNRIKGASVGIN